MTQIFLKAPGERLDYREDWSGFLSDAETISASEWAVDTGITAATTDNNDTTTTIWLSGGTHGQEYLATNQITTTANRIAKRAIKILCRNR